MTACALGLAACGRGGNQENGSAPAANNVTAPARSANQAGVTPMAQRVAVLGILNKRNGIVQNVALHPGQSARWKNVIVRLRACETTAPWEVQKLTGAFVQLDVANPQGRFQRVFSGWLYKETPSLNVVEHPVYDVSPRSCAMTHPEAGASTVRAASAARSRSSAPNSAPAPRDPAPAAPTPAPSPEPSGAAADSADSNNAR